MAGHSKWANIKFRKAGQDAIKGKLFTKLIREITMAVRAGGVDPALNSRLRNAIDKALDGNMTRDTIDRAIKRGVGNEEGMELEEIRYEGYGPGGVAILVDCVTNNRNRTAGDVRHVFTKFGGNLGTDGSVAYLFQKVGFLIVSSTKEEEKLYELAIELGSLDIANLEDGSIEIMAEPQNVTHLRQELEKNGFQIKSMEITMFAKTKVQVVGDKLESVEKLLDALDELDDVQFVYCNLQHN